MSLFPVKHPGALHRALGVPESQKIPADKMAQAQNSNDPHMRKMAAYARALAAARQGK